MLGTRMRVSHRRIGERWLLTWISGVHGVWYDTHGSHWIHGWPVRVAHPRRCLEGNRAWRWLHVGARSRRALRAGGWGRDGLGRGGHPSLEVWGHLLLILGWVGRVHIGLPGKAHRPCRLWRYLPDRSIGLHGVRWCRVHGLRVAGHRGRPGHGGIGRKS